MELENWSEGILLWLLLSPASSWVGDLWVGTSPGRGLSPGEGFVGIACWISKENVGTAFWWDSEPEEGGKKEGSALCALLRSGDLVRWCGRLLGPWGGNAGLRGGGRGVGSRGRLQRGQLGSFALGWRNGVAVGFGRWGAGVWLGAAGTFVVPSLLLSVGRGGRWEDAVAGVASSLWLFRALLPAKLCLNLGW